jgi:iron complex outermembrane receptor protein
MHVLRGLARVVMVAVLVGVVPAGARAQGGTVTFTGTVRDESGGPVAGAKIAARGAVSRAAVTDGTGAYRLGPVPAGRYILRVESLGFTASQREVSGAAGVVPADFSLAPAPVMLAPLRVVTAIRSGTGTSAASIPVKVQVIDQEEVLAQRSLATNPTELLSNLVPSFSPARQKLSTAGESFRGRRPLFLVDGVPQSNPLRDGRRDGFTIDMEAVERIEVVFGANALQGLGATGGIVNYVTVNPPASGALEQRASVSTTSNDALEGNGVGWRAHYLAAKRFGEVDVLGSVSYERRGLQFDGEDRPIAIDNVQGDIADSFSRNVLGKVGWEPTGSQRIQLTVNDFHLEQRGRYDAVPGDRSLGRPAVSVKGSPEGVEPINDVTTASLDYLNSDFGGGSLSAKAYYQDFSALFGGGRFDTFQDPAIAPVGELFDQSQNNSEKLGSRLTYARTALADAPVDLISGFDFLRDKTFQRLALTDRNWVPVTKFVNYAPFLQLDTRPLSWLSVSGGIRWEIAALDVPDFTTLAGNRADLQPVLVTGGSPSFDEPLFNIGGVITPVPGLRFYGTFAQAYTMPDVGRVLRGISTEGTAVDDFLDLAPIKTDNREVGATLGNAWGRVGATYFESESDMGSRLVPNSDGIFQVMREPTKTSGWELTGRLAPTTRLAFDAGYSRLDGRYDSDRDGRLDSDLSAADIGPDRLNLSADLNRGGRVSGRIQGFHFFDRTFRDAEGQSTAEFDGYDTVDATLALGVGRSTLSLSVANLFDAQYITYYSQAATDLDDRYFAGRGRTLTLRVESRF